MRKTGIIGIIILGGLSGIAVFHILHYALFCRHREVPEKSHCGKCGHRRVCRKFKTIDEAAEHEKTS